MMLPFLRVGPFLVQMPGLALLAGLWVATTLIEKEALHLKLNAPAILNALFYGLFGGLIGARLIYVAQHLSSYLTNPLDVFSLSISTLNLPGGLAMGAAIAFIWGRRQELPLRPPLDALAPGLAVVAIAVGVANLLSGDAYGLPSHLPWAIYLWGEYRHPIQIYEAVAALLVLIVWKRIPAESRSPGVGFLQLVALLIGARIFLEAFRADSTIWPGGFYAVQVVGLILLALLIYLAKQWEEPIEGAVLLKDSLQNKAQSKTERR